jgi:RNA polymerase sigma factor (sigma-70 family)
VEEVKRTFNDMVAEENLDELLEATRKLCGYKIKSQNIQLPNYIGVEDVMQDAAIKVYKAYKRFDPKKASANTYFTRVIERVIIDHIRHSQTQLSGMSSVEDVFDSKMMDACTGNISVEDKGLDELPKSHCLDLDSMMMNEGEEDRLFSEILIDLGNELTKREKKIFVLRYIGYTHEEIAKKMNISRPTVAKDWGRVRKLVLNLIY